MKLESIDIIEDISKEEFQEKYVKTKTPVLLKNYSKNWPAVNKWTFDYFKEIAGDVEVDLKGDWKRDLNLTEVPPVAKMPFGEYLDLISNQPTDLRIFLWNIFKEVPQLKTDFDFPKLVDGYLKSMPFVFFGGVGGSARLHYDLDLSHVFITQFAGKKRITVFTQEYSTHLYKLPYTVHSGIDDFENPNYDKYPALKEAVGMQCVLEHGDTLFMPSGTWHYIEYLSGGFSLSLRAMPANPIDKLKGAYNVAVNRNIDRVVGNMFPKQFLSYKNKVAHRKADAIIDGN